MGHTRTPKFELQIKRADESALIEGAEGLKSALKSAKSIITALHLANCKILLWGNNKTGQDYIKSKGCDYLEYKDKWEGRQIEEVLK